MKILNLFFFLCLAVPAAAQDAAEISKLFPGQEIVYKNYNETLRFYMKDGEPVAENDHEIELMVLSDKNASQYSRYKVYHSGYNELKKLSAFTMVPDDTKYKKLKVGETKTSRSSSNSVFYDDVQETAFDFPGLVQNAVEHVEYTLFQKDAHLLSPFYMPGNLAVVSAVYRVEVPDEISVRYVVKNDPGGIFSFTEEKKKRSTVYTWTAKNIPKTDMYGNAPGFRYIVPHVVVFVISCEKDGARVPFLGTVKDLYNWNYNFIKQLNITEDVHLKKITDSVTTGKTTSKEKAAAIYRWVQQNIKYVAFEDGLEGFRPRQAADVCNKRYGDCKDMSSIITKMLRMAGIKSYYTWIGTRILPYDYTELPLPITDNHMISVADIDGEWIFLDGTDPHARFGMPPYSIQNKEAMVGIDSATCKVIRVPITEADASVLTDSTFISFTDNGIKGNSSVYYTGYFGEDFYNALLYKNEKETRDYVKSRMGKASNKFIMGDYTIRPLSPQDNKLNISAGFEIPGYGKKLGNEYYLNLNLEKLLDVSLIDTAERKVPVEHDFKYTVKQYHILDVPAGYKVTYLPADFQLTGDLLNFSITYKQQGSRVIAQQEMTNKRLMIYPAEFNEWNRLIKAAAQQYKEQVVLEKQ